ncbi:MAG: hypothetical protein ACI9FN_000060 [Saprospiraceae bacterium]|jgi:hypothetical protein
MKKILIYLLFYFMLSFFMLEIVTAQVTNRIERPQGFKVQFVVGSNISQLDGDDLMGYRKFGLRAGTQINYALYTRGGLSVGLFYDEKGSSNSFSFKSSGNQQNTKLTYLSIPLDFYFDSAYRSEIQKHRIRVRLGIAISRLFDITSENSLFADHTKLFNSFDISPNIGLTYSVSKKSGLNLRFETSITNILDQNQVLDLNNLRSYLFSIQYVYSL